MADLRLEAIEGQDDATTDVGDTVEARRVLQREGDQFVVTLQEMRDRPWGHCHVALDQGSDGFLGHCGGGHSAAAPQRR